MISITRLLCGRAGPSDAMRYPPNADATTGGRESADGKIAPAVVVWNCTSACNLRCAHCYSESGAAPARDELTGNEARALIDDLADLGVRVLLFSGGEPLMREDIVELGAYAASCGLRPVLSTNGTLLSPRTAERIREAGFAYAGVSLDGLEKSNDEFRGVPGAFRKALGGIRNCIDAGVRVGVRFTLSRRTVGDLDNVFDLVRDNGIPRLCVYHLVYSGRAMAGDDLPHDEMRRAVETIFRRTEDLAAHNPETEVLTVDNPADGVYLYLQQRDADPVRAAETLRLLRANGGNASGERIGCVGCTGDVFPDQFWRTHVLGNVRERRFSEIWNDPDNSLLAELRRRKEHIKGRCATCRFFDACRGGMRARAEAVSGDIWAEEPACYLTDEEIR